jgi:urease accessory protein
VTSISIRADAHRARLDLQAGAIVPRLIEQDANYARVALVAGGALLLGGDHVHIDIAVGEGCLLDIEDIGGTVAYDADDAPSSWSVDVRVASAGALTWHGLPLIVSDGADVLRTLRISLAGDASACIRETVVLGREREIGGRMRQRTDIDRDGVPVFVEEVTAKGGVDVPGVIGRQRVLDSVLIAGARGSDDWHDSRVLQFEQSGSLARYLGMTMHSSPLENVWKSWRDGVLTNWNDRTPIPAAATATAQWR